jgi:hypothetical protein
MATVDDMYRQLRLICRKNQLGSLSPKDFQDAVNIAQNNYYDFLVGRIEQYRYDRPIPRVALNMTDNVTSRLSPFLTTTTVTVTAGAATKPTDFNKLAAIITPRNYRLYRIDYTRLPERLQDSIDPIDEENAFFVETASSFLVYPTDLATVNISYYKVPTPLVWGYTTDGSGRPIYNSGTSVQPLWYSNDIDEIIGRAAKIIGVSLMQSNDVQFGESVIQKGE